MTQITTHPPVLDARPARPRSSSTPPAIVWRPELVVKLLVSALLVVGYYALRGPWVEQLNRLYGPMYQWLTGQPLVQNPTMALLLSAAVLLALVVLWRRLLFADKRFQAPLLVTFILLEADAGFGILESIHSVWLAELTGGALTNYSPTLLAICTTLLTELVLGRFFYGRWPHLSSAYVSGISAGILVKTPYAWPFLAAAFLSICSKYVLRVGNRHLWNPTNFGITMLLFLVPDSVASLSVQAGNSIWALVVIWCLGGLILYRLGRLYISLAFILAFLPLAFLRAWFTGHPWMTEMAPLASPMFQLYICFMITDPKTTTHGWRSQVLVVVLVACAETFFRLAFKDVHSFYHALFFVGPVANLIEIVADRVKGVGRAFQPDVLARQPVGAGLLAASASESPSGVPG